MNEWNEMNHSDSTKASFFILLVYHKLQSVLLRYALYNISCF